MTQETSTKTESPSPEYLESPESPAISVEHEELKPAQMCRNKRYTVTHRNSLQRYPRRSLLVFLGLDAEALNYGGRRKYVFSGRDFGRDTRVCGTTYFEEEEIISVVRVADDAPLYINQRA